MMQRKRHFRKIAVHEAQVENGVIRPAIVVLDDDIVIECRPLLYEEERTEWWGGEYVAHKNKKITKLNNY